MSVRPGWMIGPARGQRHRERPPLRRYLERLMDARRGHPQLTSNGPQAKPLRLELSDFASASVDGRRTAQLDTTSLGSRQPGIHALLDDPTLKFRHGHQDAQL